MLIGIISDIHDHTDNLRRAMKQLAEARCGRVLCLGDIAHLTTLHELLQARFCKIELVAGNNDYPRADFAAACAAVPGVTYHGETAELEIDGKRIFMAHEPERTLNAAEMGLFQAIFFGHTHRAGQMLMGQTLIANPGDLQGRYGNPSYALYDTSDNSLRHVQL